MNIIGRVAQRITRLTTDQKIAGSNPAVLDFIFTFFTLQKSTEKNLDQVSLSPSEESLKADVETKRPGSLVAVVKPLSSTDSKELLSADEIITLPSPMPSPMERSGSSLIGDPQLPVPDEFCDGPSISSCEEDDDRRVSFFFLKKKKIDDAIHWLYLFTSAS